MVAAWAAEFEGVDGVTSSCGDIFDGTLADALVSPANSFGFMDGGIDAVYSRRFGARLQSKLQDLIRNFHDGELPVGHAQVVKLNDPSFDYLISAPTMRVPMDVSMTANAYLAFRAVVRIVNRHNVEVRKLAQKKVDYESLGIKFITKVLCPGLGTAIGQMPYEKCAKQMRRAYNQCVLKEIPRPKHLSFAAADIHYSDGIDTTRSPEIKSRVKFSATNIPSDKKN
jgi:O-acetyl-ADP-ribose deacetylase (regulator of RNase III)